MKCDLKGAIEEQWTWREAISFSAAMAIDLASLFGSVVLALYCAAAAFVSLPQPPWQIIGFCAGVGGFAGFYQMRRIAKEERKDRQRL